MPKVLLSFHFYFVSPFIMYKIYCKFPYTYYSNGTNKKKFGKIKFRLGYSKYLGYRIPEKKQLEST